MNTHTTISDARPDVVNAHTLISDIHRKMLKAGGKPDGPNESVSGTRPFIAEQPLTSV